MRVRVGRRVGAGAVAQAVAEGGPGSGEALTADFAGVLVEAPGPGGVDQDELVGGGAGGVLLRHAPSIRRGCDSFGGTGGKGGSWGVKEGRPGRPGARGAPVASRGPAPEARP